MRTFSNPVRIKAGMSADINAALRDDDLTALYEGGPIEDLPNRVRTTTTG